MYEKPQKMSDAIVYARVSSQRQVVEGQGLAGQEASCRAYAKSQNLKVIKVFRDEGQSGALLERPGMQKLLDYLSGRPKHAETITVLIDDIKRLARDEITHLKLRTAIYANNAELASPGFQFESTPHGQFVEAIMSATAALERRQNQAQVISRMKERLLAGYWPFHHVPGYRAKPLAGHGKVLVPFESEASIIKEALEGYATDRFLTQQDVQRYLQSKDFSSGKKVHLQRVKRLLERSWIYSGLVKFDPWEIPERSGHHEALIGPEPIS